MSGEGKILEFIAGCSDAAQLRTLIKNARKQNNPAVERASFLRLIVHSSHQRVLALLNMTSGRPFTRSKSC